MALTRRGIIRDGQLVVADRVDLPDGTEVMVAITQQAPHRPPTPEEIEEFKHLAARGTWADRDDMGDTGEWLQRMRGRWWRSTAVQE